MIRKTELRSYGAEEHGSAVPMPRPCAGKCLTPALPALPARPALPDLRSVLPACRAAHTFSESTTSRPHVAPVDPLRDDTAYTAYTAREDSVWSGNFSYPKTGTVSGSCPQTWRVGFLAALSPRMIANSNRNDATIGRTRESPSLSDDKKRSGTHPRSGGGEMIRRMCGELSIFTTD